MGAAEAARQLGVQRSTLYAYVSRGLIDRRVAIDGRTSLYSVDDIDTLAGRARRREIAPRPSLDVQIVTGITTLDEDGVRYRGHLVADLARTCTYEQVAELLWTGRLGPAAWPAADPDDVQVARRATRTVAGDGVPAVIAIANALDGRHGGDDAPTAARRLLGVIASVSGSGPPSAGGGRIAPLLAERWLPGRGSELAPALERALILLADHELATSTLAVRIAGSVRTSAYGAFIAGLAVLPGPYHGGASRAVVDLLSECERSGVAGALSRRSQLGERLPGFGHKVYVGDDPRLGPLLEAVEALPAPLSRSALVQRVIAEAGARIVQRPNVDLGLGALLFVAGLSASTPIFAIARIAGFAAHLMEELEERPVRYRGLARPPAT